MMVETRSHHSHRNGSSSSFIWVEFELDGAFGATMPLKILQPRAYDQRIVISLSSDKAFWEATMNNEVVREINELYNNGISQDEESSYDTPGEDNAAMDFIKWIFDGTMVKATEVFKKITKLVIELLNSHNDDCVNKKGKDPKSNNRVEEMLKTSVLLSIIVMLVVMVFRACNKS